MAAAVRKGGTGGADGTWEGGRQGKAGDGLVVVTARARGRKGQRTAWAARCVGLFDTNPPRVHMLHSQPQHGSPPALVELVNPAITIQLLCLRSGLTLWSRSFGSSRSLQPVPPSDPLCALRVSEHIPNKPHVRLHRPHTAAPSARSERPFQRPHEILALSISNA